MRSKWNEILTHIAVWLCLVLVPLFMQIEDPSLNMKFMSRVWFMLFSLMVVFYSNYLWGIDRLLFRKKYVLYVIFNIIIFLVINFMNDITSEIVDAVFGRPHRRPSGGMKNMFIYNDIVFFLLGVGASLGVRYSKRLLSIEDERNRLETEKLASEISLLKYQIQPHFFFNTLNNIYALIGKSPVDAQTAVHSLSKMMRYILYENTSDTISLAKEVDFMVNYDKLMRLRLNQNISVNAQAIGNIDGVEVPPLLFIPLLENAFKHVSTTANAFIDCRLEISDELLTFEVRNSMSETPGEDKSHSGIGLSNLRKRLEIIYQDRYTFDASADADAQVFTARLVIPIHRNS